MKRKISDAFFDSIKETRKNREKLRESYAIKRRSEEEIRKAKPKGYTYIWKRLQKGKL